MAYADDLLEQAQNLAQIDPTKPKQASLRRAVSTAYYALFHLLISDAIKNWKRPAQRHLLARAFEHGQMRSACEKKRAELSRAVRDQSSRPRLTQEKRLYTVVDIFVQMQRHRHVADYDFLRKWSRTETLEEINSVGTAFESWRAIRKRDAAQDFLLSLLVRER